jgi:hypothetical protein
MACRDRNKDFNKNPEQTDRAAFFIGLIHKAAPRQWLRSQSHLPQKVSRINEWELWNIYEQQHVTYVVYQKRNITL